MGKVVFTLVLGWKETFHWEEDGTTEKVFKKLFPVQDSFLREAISNNPLVSCFLPSNFFSYDSHSYAQFVRALTAQPFPEITVIDSSRGRH